MNPIKAIAKATVTTIFAAWLLTGCGSKNSVSPEEEELVNESPIAHISADPTSGKAPQDVDFDFSGSSAGNGSGDDDDEIEYGFNPGDQSGKKTLDSPFTSHTYEKAGTYTAILIVTDKENQKDTASLEILISELLGPTADFDVTSLEGRAPHKVTFTSTSEKGDADLAHYGIDLDEDGNIDVNFPESPFEYTFSTTGDHNVRLYVTDHNGLRDYVEKTIKVNPDNKPIARLDADTTSGLDSLLVTFNLSGSSDDFKINSYIIDFDGDGNYDDTTTSTSIKHLYPIGTYNATGRVIDDQDQVSDPDTVKIDVLESILSNTKEGVALMYKILTDSLSCSISDSNKTNQYRIPSSTEYFTETFNYTGTCGETPFVAVVYPVGADTSNIEHIKKRQEEGRIPSMFYMALGKTKTFLKNLVMNQK